MVAGCFSLQLFPFCCWRLLLLFNYTTSQPLPRVRECIGIAVVSFPNEIGERKKAMTIQSTVMPYRIVSKKKKKKSWPTSRPSTGCWPFCLIKTASVLCCVAWTEESKREKDRFNYIGTREICLLPSSAAAAAAATAALRREC
jgi:hypothetical protein